jgi:choline dehydrogenase
MRLHIAQALIHRGRRWSAARGYLHPARGRSNLTIWTGALVRRVTVENGAATGIEIERRGEAMQVECAREVVLCAGAINTPQLLMLSGIGDADDLRPLGIEVKAHVPGVGRNLENHPGVNVQFATRHEDSLVAELGPLGQARLGAEWLLRGRGLGASNFFEAGAFLCSRPEVAYPNLQFEFLPLTRRLKGGRLVAVPGFQFWLDLSRPESGGRVRLRSADPTAAPSIVFNHLEDRRDLRDLVDGVRIAREIAAQPALERVRTGEIAPGPDVQSDADLERFVRAGLGTSYHPLGTCRMGTDPEAVVDGEGRMAAVGRLRVVDASIMPRIVTANLAASVIMMAEKISDRIRGRPPLPPSDASFFAAPAPGLEAGRGAANDLTTNGEHA